jgi:hypothetical protein
MPRSPKAISSTTASIGTLNRVRLPLGNPMMASTMIAMPITRSPSAMRLAISISMLWFQSPLARASLTRVIVSFSSIGSVAPIGCDN